MWEAQSDRFYAGARIISPPADYIFFFLAAFLVAFFLAAFFLAAMISLLSSDVMGPVRSDPGFGNEGSHYYAY